MNYEFLTASGLNATREELATRRIVPSHDSRPARVAPGQKVQVPDAVDSSFRHPWSLAVTWRKDCAVARFRREGFVNGDIALNGSGDDDIATAPEFELRGWRDCQDPNDGDGKGIPPFFCDMGAFPPSGQVNIDSAGFVSIRDEGLPEPTRRLFAMDVWLEMARLTYGIEATILDASGVSGQVADYFAVPDDTAIKANGTAARVRRGNRMPKEKTGGDVLQRLLGKADDDDGLDRIMLATVYAVSPENWQGEQPRPDETFKFYVAQQQFWDLRYERGRQQEGMDVKPNKPFFSGLAWGMGDTIINQTNAPTNDLISAFNAAYNSATPKGHFSLA